jgi:hypothetical protein
MSPSQRYARFEIPITDRAHFAVYAITNDLSTDNLISNELLQDDLSGTAAAAIYRFGRATWARSYLDRVGDKVHPYPRAGPRGRRDRTTRGLSSGYDSAAPAVVRGI